MRFENIRRIGTTTVLDLKTGEAGYFAGAGRHRTLGKTFRKAGKKGVVVVRNARVALTLVAVA